MLFADTNQNRAEYYSLKVRRSTGWRAVTLGANRDTIGGKGRKDCRANWPMMVQDAASAASWALNLRCSMSPPHLFVVQVLRKKHGVSNSVFDVAMLKQASQRQRDVHLQVDETNQ